jgi:hypothetical protein
MTGNNEKDRPDQSQHLAEEVNHLADEAKLLAINLAITLAKLRGRHKILEDLEPQFSELIKKANDTAQQVSDVLKAFENRKRMISSLPSSSQIIKQRGAYDSLEARLVNVYQLSQNVLQTLGDIKRQEQVG